MRKAPLFFFMFLLYFSLLGQDSIWYEVNNADRAEQKIPLLESIFERYKYQAPQVADSSAHQIIHLAKIIESDSSLLKGYQLLAAAKLVQTQYDSCKIYLDKGWEALDSNKKTSVAAARIHKLRGLLFYYEGKYESSLEENFIALEIWAKLNQGIEQAKILNNIGIDYERLGEPEKALDFYKKGLMKIPAENQQQRVIFMNNIAVVLINLKKYDEAETTLLEAKEITEEIAYNSLLIDINGSLSEIYFTQEDYEKGILAAEENVRLTRSTKDFWRLVRNLNMLGSQYNLLSKPSNALPHLQEAQEISLLYSIGEHRMEIFENLAQSYRMIGDFETATAIQDSIMEYNKSRFSEQKRQITEELNIKYETAEKDKKLLISEHEIKKKTTQRNTLILSILLLSGFIYLLWSRNKQKNELDKQRILINEQQIQQMEEEKKTMALTYMLEGQEAERNRIAQDLHDGLGGLLASVKNHFSLIQEEIEKLEKLSIYTKTTNMIDQACSEVRRISHNLMPTGLKLNGLRLTVEELCQSLQEEHQLAIKLETIGKSSYPLSQSVEIFAYRIIQEGLNNCIKHANANNILVQIGFYEGELQLVIEDDGAGFDRAIQTKGIGLLSMESRVQFLKGSIDIDSKKGSGTTISVNIPTYE